MYVLLLFCVSLVNGLQRNLTAETTPGCVKHCDKFWVSYVKAEGPNDTLHYLWDFTGKPSIFLALTTTNSTLNISWQDYESLRPSIFFSSPPLYTFALVLNKVIEFDDVNDTGILTSQSANVSYDPAKFSWAASRNLTTGDGAQAVSLSMRGSNYSSDGHTLLGSLVIQLDAFGAENHDVDLPRLLHSPNSTQCRITLQSMLSDAGFNHSRWAVELYLVSSDDRNTSARIHNKKSLDDENTPGVFAMTDLLTPQADNQNSRGSYLQWRPVVYTSAIANMGNSTDLTVHDLVTVPDPEHSLEDSTAYKYYATNLTNLLVQEFVVSFGSKEDGFYAKTNYTAWTFLIDYGSPSDEKFSLLVIMVMAIGLGLPALLILIGGAYMLARRCSRNRDELSLGSLETSATSATSGTVVRAPLGDN